MRRPSPKEISRKIKQAREAVSNNRISIVNPVSIAGDALELGFTVEDIQTVLIGLLDEITPKDYAGQYAPQRSYEDEILQCKLFPFRWNSNRLGCRVYFKFAFKENRVWLVSLHEDRPEEE